MMVKTWAKFISSHIFFLIYLSISIMGQPYTEEGRDLYDYDAASDDTIDNEDTVSDGGKRTELEMMATPQFTSQAQSVLVNEGDTIRLPCMVDRLEGFVMLWKKNKDIITVASQIIEKRVKLENDLNGNQLVIEDAQPSDGGVYTCQISAYKVTELMHTVTIRIKPVISTNPEDVLIVTTGSSASLKCNIVSGTPTPQVRWRRKERKLTTGEEEIVGSTLTFSEVTRHDAGYYLCLADNGFGPRPVQKEVRLEVHYSPEIDVEEVVIHTALGDEEEIVCNVHAVPHAEVTWLKDGQTVDKTTTNVLINQKHSRHSLTMLNIDQNSVGKYQCRATNTMGEETKFVQITGHAKEAIILSPMESLSKDSYMLEWAAQSKSPVSQFEVSVRKSGETEWITNEVIVDIPEVNDREDIIGDSEIYEGSLELTGLEQSTLYQVMVASRNMFGLSEPGHVFTFTTKGPDPVQQPMVETESSSSPSETAAKVSLGLVILTMFIIM